jgi:hypothetical protein
MTLAETAENAQSNGVAIVEEETLLRHQAWDYFVVVAAQRLTVLNFYIAISSVVATVQVVIPPSK